MPTPSSPTMPSIQDSIKRQLDLNRSKNLLFTHAAQIMEVEPGFLAALEERLDSETGAAPEDVSFTAREFVQRLYAINPYVQVSPPQVEALEQIYRRTWQALLRTRDVKTALVETHYPALAGWLAGLYPEEFREPLASSPGIGHVTYGEYSAELQVELLGIDLARLRQPVMDIGCGSQANLVRHLRALGIEAYGIDRRIETQAPYLSRVDWFDFAFEPGKWGALVSNMGFSNHLNYVYRHDAARLEGYLLKMKEIVAALAPGGAFYYAPALPFIEDQLSPQYVRVTREQKVNGIFVSRIVRVG